MWLQEEELGTMEGMGKNKVRTQVAAQALFKMYETHDVLRVRIVKRFRDSLRRLAHAIYNDFSSAVKIENFIRKSLV